MAVLDVYMNGYLLGELTKSSTGSHQFAYAQQWLAIPGSRPISLSKRRNMRAMVARVLNKLCLIYWVR